MKLKWYYSLLLSILALIGASQIEFAVPNQELVVDFTSETVSFLEAELAIANIKSQLENAGASHIKVQQHSSRLRITYYSTKDVAAIRTVFSKNTPSSILANTIPGKSNDTDSLPTNTKDEFQFNFSEIQQGSDIAKDFNGQLVDVQSTTIRFFNPFVYHSFNGISLEQKQRVVNTALKINEEIALAIIPFNTYAIPEVRAGPLS